MLSCNAETVRLWNQFQVLVWDLRWHIFLVCRKVGDVLTEFESVPTPHLHLAYMWPLWPSENAGLLAFHCWLVGRCQCEVCHLIPAKVGKPRLMKPNRKSTNRHIQRPNKTSEKAEKYCLEKMMLEDCMFQVGVCLDAWLLMFCVPPFFIGSLSPGRNTTIRQTSKAKQRDIKNSPWRFM